MIRQFEQPFTFKGFNRLLFQYRKHAVVYGLSVVIISFNLCFFLHANLRTLFPETILDAVQIGCFGVMGVINVWFFHKPNAVPGLALSGAKLTFVCLLFVIIALVLFVYYCVSGNNGWIMAFASSGAFLLPFLMHQGWKEYMQIPEKQYAIWYLPGEMAVTGSVLPVLAKNAMQVQLIMARQINNKANSFPVTTSGKLKLGKMFERFIEDQKITGKQVSIETSVNRTAFGWQFYEKKWFGCYSRYLNPAKNLFENGIKANAKIVVKRICEQQIGGTARQFLESHPSN